MKFSQTDLKLYKQFQRLFERNLLKLLKTARRNESLYRQFILCLFINDMKKANGLYKYLLPQKVCREETNKIKCGENIISIF